MKAAKKSRIYAGKDDLLNNKDSFLLLTIKECQIALGSEARNNEHHNQRHMCSDNNSCRLTSKSDRHNHNNQFFRNNNRIGYNKRDSIFFVGSFDRLERVRTGCHSL